jgi:hypothetical protein
MCPRVLLPLIAHAVAALLLVALPASAQTAAIADPTRPAGAAAASPGIAGARGARTTGEPAAPPVWPKLQSVQVGDNGSASAMIDGRIVQVGEAVGPLTLVAIDAQGVLLRGARFEQRLALLPGIEKTALAHPAAPQPAIARITPTHTSKTIALPLKLDMQIDSPEPIAPAALAQAPTKDFR